MDKGNCQYNDDPVYVVYSALGSFFLPLLIMLYVYARIACVIAQRQDSILKPHKIKEKVSVHFFPPVFSVSLLSPNDFHHG